MKRTFVVIALVAGTFLLATACRRERVVQPVQAPPVVTDTVPADVIVDYYATGEDALYTIDPVDAAPEPPAATGAVRAAPPADLPVQASPTPAVVVTDTPAVAEIVEPTADPVLDDIDTTWVMDIQARALDHQRQVTDPAGGAAMQARDLMNRMFGDD